MNIMVAIDREIRRQDQGVDARIEWSQKDGAYVVMMRGKAGLWVRVASAASAVVADDHARALGAQDIVITL